MSTAKAHPRAPAAGAPILEAFCEPKQGVRDQSLNRLRAPALGLPAGPVGEPAKAATESPQTYPQDSRYPQARAPSFRWRDSESPVTREFRGRERPSGNGAVLEATTTAEAAGSSQEGSICRSDGWAVEEEARGASRTHFLRGSSGSEPSGNEPRTGDREAAMPRENPDRESSEVARFRWESG